MILLSTILTISKRRPEKNSFEIPPGSGIEIRGCPFAPPSWFFRGQLNPESYLPLGQANLVVKYLHRLNQNMYFWNFTFFIMAQYMVTLVCFSISYHTTYRYILYWISGKLTSKRASWNYAKLAPGQVLSEIVCPPLQVHHMVFRFINLSEMTIQKMTSWNYFEL